MRKMFLLFGMLAMVGVLFLACSDQQDLTSPEDAAFGKKVSTNCTGEDKTNMGLVEDKIDEVLLNRPSKKGAKQILDNIARKVCADRHDATPSMVEGFYDLLVDQPVDELVGGWEAAVELLAMVSEFASGTPFGGGFPVPPEAFGQDGGFGIVIPGAAKTITANSGEAALVADASSFPGITEPVTIAFYRIPDPVPGVPDYPIPGYQAYPEAWDFSGSAQPTGGVDFWMCVVDDEDHPLPVGVWDRLQVGHERGELPPELLDRMVDLDGVFVSCGGAGEYQPPSPPGGLVISSGSPTWLQLAGTILEPLVSRVLSVKPLHAMYFAGKGLGGRGTSFSPFAPVDPGPPGEPGFNTMTVHGAGPGSGVITGGNGINCSWDDGLESGQCTTQVEDWVLLGITARSDPGYLFDGFSGDCGGTDSYCAVQMSVDRDVTATFSVAPFRLWLTVSGPGTVSDGLGGTCDATMPQPCIFGYESFPVGETLHLYATPDEGYTNYYSGDCEGIYLRQTCDLPPAPSMSVGVTFESPV